MSYFVERNGQQFGPYDPAALATYVGTGQILLQDVTVDPKTGSRSTVRGVLKAAGISRSAQSPRQHLRADPRVRLGVAAAEVLVPVPDLPQRPAPFAGGHYRADAGLSYPVHRRIRAYVLRHCPLLLPDLGNVFPRGVQDAAGAAQDHGGGVLRHAGHHLFSWWMCSTSPPSTRSTA